MDNKTEQFQKLMEQMLSNFQENQDKDAAVIVDQSLQQLGVSEEARKKAADAGKVIDKIQVKSAELEEAKKKGSREKWMTREVARLIQKTDDEEKQKKILEVLGTTLDKQFDQEINNPE